VCLGDLFAHGHHRIKRKPDYALPSVTKHLVLA
jgi:hypothetical protein